MIRQLSNPTYSVYHTEKEKEYKPTVMLLMDCEMRPLDTLTELQEIGDLYRLYGTNSDNYNFRVAESLLSTNKYRIMCINAKCDDKNRATTCIYSNNGKQYEIHPNYNALNKIYKGSKNIKKKLVNGNYAYTITFDSLTKNYYLLLPYTNISKIMLYLVYDRNTFSKVAHNVQIDSTKWYSNMFEDDSTEEKEHLKNPDLWQIDLDETWKTFLDKVRRIIEYFGLNASIDYNKHTLTINYTFETNFIVGNADIDYNYESSDELIYQTNFYNTQLIAYSKMSNLLNNIQIIIEKYNTRYSIVVNLYDKDTYSILDSESYDGTNIDDLIDLININSSYIYVLSYNEDFLPLGTFSLTNYNETEILLETDYTDIISELLPSTIIDNRIDYIYDNSKNEIINDYFVELTNECDSKCIYCTLYTPNYTIGRNEAIFKDIKYYVVDIGFTFDIIVVLLMSLCSNGSVECMLPYNITYEENLYDYKNEILIYPQDNEYYSSLLNPLCMMNDKVTTLAESIGLVLQLNYIQTEISKHITDLTESIAKSIVAQSSKVIRSFVDIVPNITLESCSLDNTLFTYRLSVELINNHNINYDFNINITY